VERGYRVPCANICWYPPSNISFRHSRNFSWKHLFKVVLEKKPINQRLFSKTSDFKMFPRKARNIRQPWRKFKIPCALCKHLPVSPLWRSYCTQPPSTRSALREDFWREQAPALRKTTKFPSNKAHKTPPKMRSVGEHFCRNDSTVIPCTLCEHLRVSPSNISFRHSRNFSSKSPKYSADRCGSFCTQNSLLLLSEFSVDDRTRFFLLSLVPLLSSFFGKKEERNEHPIQKE